MQNKAFSGQDPGLSARMDIFHPAHDFAKRLSFQFVLPEDVRALSVKKITDPLTFDDLGHPQPDGLYDPAMGPIERNSKCQTCGLGTFQCPGHFGHIELAVPVYNPLTFAPLFNVLRMSCLNCHRFRGSRLRLVIVVGQLTLLNAHLLLEAQELEHWVTGRLFLAQSLDAEESAGHVADLASVIDKLQKYVRRLVHNVTPAQREDKSAMVEDFRRTVIGDFLKKPPTSSQCQQCKAYAHSLHRHANAKIFLNPLRKTLKVLNESKNVVSADRLDHILPLADDAQNEHDTEHGKEEEAEEEVRDETGMKYLTPMHAYEHMRQIWSNERELLELLFSPQISQAKLDFRIFFSEVLAVPPCRFRPPSISNDSQFDHPQNTYLADILKLNQRIIQLNQSLHAEDVADQRNISQANVVDQQKEKRSFAQLINVWIQLQEQVNYLFDASRNQQPGGKAPPAGIKQILEKKEGLFRKHMMGKRVNFAARSVISPDACIETSEIGVPLVFALKLTYPEPVTAFNRHQLAQCVRNGVHVHPGATHILHGDGTISNLEHLGPRARHALAGELMDLGAPKRVLRHIHTGDVVLMNRQPTLHKPSMMAHRVRVLRGEKTLRMHYANCNTYNADFDGDEMNLHFPQNELARSELTHICNTNRQYLGVTDGSPLRGLIQDHISMGVRLTTRDVFLNKGDFQQFLFSALGGDLSGSQRIECPLPAIFLPHPLYTGKQLVTAVLLNLTRGSPPLNLTSKCRVSEKLWGPTAAEEAVVTVLQGHLLTGICDKTQFGASAYGITHAVYELYGPDTAGRLLTCIGRLLTRYAMHAGFTCRLDDLMLTAAANQKRRELLRGVPSVGLCTARALLDIDHPSSDSAPPNSVSDRLEMRKRLMQILRSSDDGARQVDGAYKGAMNKVTSQVIEACLPDGQLRAFPSNHMALMTQTGAKGSLVNFSQISGLLGQQELEGRRVPIMASGKTLPSFPAWDVRPRAGGYITQRFLTGLRPQEFFFHCMAGREGLIDTAVKTSRSGYLQRCLVKHLEGCTVAYDGTVRLVDDGSIVQFVYGEDGLDVTKQKYLRHWSFAALNFDSLVASVRPDFVLDAVNTDDARRLARRIAKSQRQDSSHRPNQNPGIIEDPVLNAYSPYTHLCAVSEKYYGDLDRFVDGELNGTGSAVVVRDEKQFKALMWLRYMRSLVEPGEAVGLLAAQSIGEPSTQMTLNTFHFAGFGAKNVTLGIPRLREIIMTASQRIKTPTMTIPLMAGKAHDQSAIRALQERLNKKTLQDVIRGVQVQEFVTTSGQYAQAVSSRRCRVYSIHLTLPAHQEDRLMTRADWRDVMENDFVARLTSAIQRILKKKKTTEDLVQSHAEKKNSRLEMTEGEEKPTMTSRKKFDVSDDSDDANDGDGAEQDEQSATLDASEAREAMRRKQLASYQDDNPDLNDDDDKMDVDDDNVDRRGDASNDVDKGNADGVDRKEREEVDKFSKLAEHRNIRNLIITKEHVTVDYVVPVTVPRLPMLDIVEEDVLRHVVVQQLVPGVQRVHWDESQRALTTEGVNLRGLMQAGLLHALPLDHRSLVSNDVHAVLQVLGVEAARAVIVNEIAGVFAVYGISVDYRHLALIADYMTRQGTYLPFNRTGMEWHASPLLKMSFESTVGFLRTAVLTGEWDALRGPASRLVCGLPVRGGTGSFDVLTQIA